MGEEVPQSPLGLEDIQIAVEREIYARLTADPCPECHRGRNADSLGATALSQLVTGLRRLDIAKSKLEHSDTEKVDLNPLALVATIRKLPEDSPTRALLIETLEGHVITLQEALKSFE